MSLRAARFRAQAVASIIAARYASKCLSGRGRVQTLLTSWRALGMAKSRGVSDECRNSHPPAARLRPALSLARRDRLRARATRSAAGAEGRKAVRHRALSKSGAAPSRVADTSPQAGPSLAVAPSRLEAPSPAPDTHRSSPRPIPGDASRPGVAAPARTVPSRSQNHPLVQRDLSLMRRQGRPVRP